MPEDRSLTDAEIEELLYWYMALQDIKDEYNESPDYEAMTLRARLVDMLGYDPDV
jgi:hypothetical protein